MHFYFSLRTILHDFGRYSRGRIFFEDDVCDEIPSEPRRAPRRGATRRLSRRDTFRTATRSEPKTQHAPSRGAFRYARRLSQSAKPSATRDTVHSKGPQTEKGSPGGKPWKRVCADCACDAWAEPAALVRTLAELGRSLPRACVCAACAHAALVTEPNALLRPYALMRRRCRSRAQRTQRSRSRG